ncbi:MAG: YebC/PmpR family DNA-binding transcriptional regulator [Clostridiales Family XIII bacterium]|jgi:YebC/PmpR family DNA-binding regulatory protein|nr:YebC/PmpR family DNA-binding transcriptional regulator [Clostridiales Family XIII bacterium]
MGRHGTIAGRKAAQDNKRAAIFTKYARAIMVAAKGGGDPGSNASLKNAIDKARGINMPNDKITRAIKKGTGELEGESYETASFEGYGPSGVAVIVDVLTDNKNRTTSAVKHAFDRFGGNLGVPGCVSYMFERKGVILIEMGAGADEDAIMEAGLDAGLEDIIDADEFFEIRTTPDDFLAVAEALRGAGYELAESDVEYIPNMETAPKNDADLRALVRLIDALDENDDVQKVYTNSAVELVSE